MSYRYSRAPRRPRDSGRGCLGALAWFGVILLALIAFYGLLARPQISAYLGEQAATMLGGPAPATTTNPEIPPQAGSALSGAVAALPNGELVITEADVNGYIAANPQALAPIDSASLRFTGGQALVDLRAYGISGTASAGLDAQDGRIVVVNPQLDGPLGLALSGQEIAAAITNRLNAELASQGRRVESLRVEEGRLVLITQ